MELHPISASSGSALDLSVTADRHAEALAVLTDLAARRREAQSLAPALAARALRVTQGADFAVARDALEALLRRFNSARDVVVRTSADGYRVTAARGRAARAYELWLADAGALVGSCSCPDFGKASLGLCKHLLAAALRPKLRAGAPRALRWDPVRPLTGVGDRLARLWHDPHVPLPRSLASLFQPAPAARPIDPRALAGARRALAVDALLRACRRDPRLAEPAIVPMLEDERAAAARGLGALGARQLDRLLRGLARPLFPYQRDGVTRFLATGRLLLADDMGLGKTAQAIASCHALFAAGAISRAMVVAPAALKPQWQREWAAFSPVELTLVEGPPDARARLYHRRTAGVLLVNYEQLLRDLPEVLRYAPELVILDEAQRIKNWETRTAAVVKRLDPSWRLVLTGTPMENRLDELSSIMEWVDEQALEPRWRLASWHATRADGAREVTGARNLDTLRARLAPSMVRRVRRDVLAQLPPRRDTQIPLALTDAQQVAHDDLLQPIASLIGRARNRALTQAEFLKLMRLLNAQRMICNALALRDFAATWPDLTTRRRRTDALLAALGSPKLCDLRERLVDLAVVQDRKIVVFSQWRRMLQLAAWASGDVLERAGVRAVFFTGQESSRRRTENLVVFHDDAATRVLFASDAGGVGLNLQRAASCCINLELPWNPAVLEQRIGRIFRLGQTQPVEIYNYVAQGGIEERIAKLVGDKRALFTGLFDGTSDEVTFDSSGSFLSRVHEVLRPEIDDVPSSEQDSDREDVEPAGFDPEPVDDADLVGTANGDGSDALTAAPCGPTEVMGHDTPSKMPAPEPPTPDRAATGAPPGSPDLMALTRALSEIAVRPTADGRISVELPASAASALGGLLRALATAVEGTGSILNR